MRRKNILKFVSLLGIGSFVMLAAASCTSTPTPTPTPNPNPGDEAAARELTVARASLTSLLNSKNTNVEMYADYAKIQNALKSAYTTAEQTSQNSSTTLEQVKSATSNLQTAIDKAATDKKNFDQSHNELLMAYRNLKTTVSQKSATVSSLGLSNPQYSAILKKVNASYQAAEKILSATLDPISGSAPTPKSIAQASNSISTETNPETLKPFKTNADMFNSYQFYKLDSTKLTDVQSKNTMPSNYSFVGYSVGLDNANWSFAQRTVWTNGSDTGSTTRLLNQSADSVQATQPEGASNPEATATKPLTDVSWIYSLTGTNAKYTVKFTYYGPETGYLYFPYKLIKQADSNNLGLQYKLNTAAQPTPITFGTQENDSGPAATVDSINIAKVMIPGLAFGENTIELSVPATKVAPMIGNMYLTSTDAQANKQKIENSIFGNSVTTENNRTIISVDALNGYSLASDWSTYIAEYSGADLTLNNEKKADEKYYLIGFVGGTSERRIYSITENVQKLPSSVTNQNSRTYTFYVNAPKAGAYYIKGVFTSGISRDLKFSTGDMSSNNNNNVTVKQLSTGNYSTITLRTFDTSATTGPTQVTTDPTGRKTLTLVEGLNKIVVSGATENMGNAPNFGYLEFILNETQPETTNVSNPS
ncbi:FIVAR domain-containing protein [Mycoplasmoides gallisepticum]|uniref:FIVAR domain-containing protein n=1 Tax=Mycoplasmoides gallisepticum TaxID=2096 RepID=UPI0012450A82|nr:FIVAR domain-containing protein [Mycoplasmoides gallisepticum]QEX47144.1 hypothetical protein F6J63_01115 [Mycoplasmoides gallisepticum]ULH62461.1 FIVAR domain-containing protein [Mycoplasmoides gallisepticum]ULH68526.1 FIVAR domain-containing protein [Mycoplasmoides gallisepticum]WGG24173.1 FIVAR domain-containing protein [Mycoplasmoides gallisepticum]WGG24930.1 FIVAR domain-containing protein [Mycoplasmoides gallisepticum]